MYGRAFCLKSSSSVCFSILFVVSKNYVGKSECQQLICEILRATPEAASADAAVQTARLASKAPSKEKRQVTVVSYSIRT